MSDIYSFAICMSIFFTKERPYDKKGICSLGELYRLVFFDNLRPNLLDAKDSIPHQELNHLIRNCWKNDLLERPEISKVETTLHSILEKVII